jgi:hypothetical protein
VNELPNLGHQRRPARPAAALAVVFPGDEPSARVNVRPEACRLLHLAAHLHFKAVRIRDVKAALGRSNHQAATLQLRFNGRLDALIRVPVGQRVRNVIDPDLAAGPAARIASNDDVVA